MVMPLARNASLIRKRMLLEMSLQKGFSIQKYTVNCRRFAKVVEQNGRFSLFTTSLPRWPLQAKSL